MSSNVTSNANHLGESPFKKTLPPPLLSFLLLTIFSIFLTLLYSSSLISTFKQQPIFLLIFPAQPFLLINFPFKLFFHKTQFFYLYSTYFHPFFSHLSICFQAHFNSFTFILLMLFSASGIHPHPLPKTYSDDKCDKVIESTQKMCK